MRIRYISGDGWDGAGWSSVGLDEDEPGSGVGVEWDQSKMRDDGIPGDPVNPSIS